MTCGHLFNGIGGFALAAHWMDWENIMHCEIDTFCNKVMNHHFPNSYQHEDIRTTDFTIWRNRIDLITGGFPCQPYSTAGKRKGKEDDRHLWPQMLRAIREIQPSWIVGENVRGLTNWNGGLVFDEVQADLEAEGYELLPFLLPAAGVNAPHRRDRIWFIAHSAGNGYKRENGFAKDRCQKEATEGEEQREKRDEIQREWLRADIGGNDAKGVIADTESFRRDNGATKNKREAAGEKYSSGDTAEICAQQSIANTSDVNGRAGTRRKNRKETDHSRSDWANFPTQSPVCGRNDGLSVGLADIPFSKWRKEGIKALGNAVVPQLVYQIFKAIEQWQLSQE